MRNIFLFLTLFLGAQVYGGSDCLFASNVETSSQQTKANTKDTEENTTCGASLFEVKAGYFFFESKKMQQVYDGGFDLQLSGSHQIVDKYLSVYSSLEYAQSSGRALGTGEKTKMHLFPISLGLQANIPIINYFNGYVGIGPRYVFAWQHNDSNFVPRKVNGNDIGFYANAGFLGMLPCRLTFDAFMEYSYIAIQFHGDSSDNVIGHRVQVGGFVFGGGIGYSF